MIVEYRLPKERYKYLDVIPMSLKVYSESCFVIGRETNCQQPALDCTSSNNNMFWLNSLMVERFRIAEVVLYSESCSS